MIAMFGPLPQEPRQPHSETESSGKARSRVNVKICLEPCRLQTLLVQTRTSYKVDAHEVLCCFVGFVREKPRKDLKSVVIIWQKRGLQGISAHYKSLISFYKYDEVGFA